MASSDSTRDDNSSESPTNAKKVDRRVQTKKRSPKRRISDSEWNSLFDRFRDVGFLVFGLAGAAHQMFWANPPNPVVYPILAALLGAPIAFALDDHRKDIRDEQEKK